jgi:outer membrane protein OmpA-like peptidoglycan-associated protein
MSNGLVKLRVSLVCGAVAISLALPVAVKTAVAGDQPSAEQILKALTPKRTRGLTVDPAEAARTADEQQFLNSVRSRTTRSLTNDDRDRIATIVKDKPSIDLEVNFDYDSAEVNSRAAPVLKALGDALSDPAMKDNTYILAGYTDAKGSEEYNQELSDRRADAVKHYLVEKYGISAASLRTVGYGKTRLKDPDHPFAPENRRVQVVNTVDGFNSARQ